MDYTLFGLFAATVLAATAAFIWVAIKLSKTGSKSKMSGDYVEDAKEDVEHIFNEEFREELRNRGRLHFEKIINENAMFLQQDLRLTTSQVNEYMKNQITKTLKDEFAKYEKSINAAKDQAIEAMEQTQRAIDEQRQLMEKQLHDEVEKEKTRALEKFESNMGSIINHYIIEAIGNEIDLSNQMDYIFANLEENKKDIVDDIRGGA